MCLMFITHVISRYNVANSFQNQLTVILTLLGKYVLCKSYLLVYEVDIICDKKNYHHLLDDTIATMIKSPLYLLHIILQILQSVGKKEQILHCCLVTIRPKPLLSCIRIHIQLLFNQMAKVRGQMFYYSCWLYQNTNTTPKKFGLIMPCWLIAHIVAKLFFFSFQGPVWHSVLQRASQPRIPPLRPTLIASTISWPLLDSVFATRLKRDKRMENEKSLVE